MKLYIAEKPSLGRAIAEVLPKPHTRGDGFVKSANGDVVSWCIGHLLEQAEPHQYNSEFKKWKQADLPIVPEKWQLHPKNTTRKQFAVLKKLIKQADELVHAGDPDREGQLLVDEVINYVGVPQAKKQAVQRLLISDLNATAVKRALSKLKSNREFVPLATSALARSRADWLYGINLTRVFTLAGQRAGFNGVLSVGRVQTPVLGLVVRRDREIEHFVSVPFYELWATIACECGSRFLAKWKAEGVAEQHLDSDGRVLNKEVPTKLAQQLKGKFGEVETYSDKQKSELPPLPYNLSALQIDAARRFGLSAQQVLSTCQDLYEKHKLITYPRSDCRYLPKEQKDQAGSVLAAIDNSCAPLSEAAKKADVRLNSRAWNDAKVAAHHAIIPTEKPLGRTSLNRSEAQVYELIARQYVAQFYPAHIYQEVKVAVRIEGSLFTANSRETSSLGWRNLFPKRTEKSDADAKEFCIPKLSKGDQIQCAETDVREKMTQPPLQFTDASLLAAMTGISRFVQDPDIRKVLRETDGLGTEATRAGIIELLFKREFLSRSGKNIVSTPAGRALIDCLPESVGLPDMTAQWERHLEAISQRQSSYSNFMQPLLVELNSLVEFGAAANAESFKGLKVVKQKPSSRNRTKSRRRPPKPRSNTASRFAV